MIKNVSIRNFKSIKELDFKAKRVNVFIGEPNTGKSNILEALGMFSLIYTRIPGEVPIRYQDPSNLFYDNDVHNSLPHVKVDDYSYRISYNDQSGRISLLALDREGADAGEEDIFDFDMSSKVRGKKMSEEENYYGIPHFFIKYYQFKVLETHQGFGPFLNPPYGDNLFNVLSTSKELRNAVSGLFTEQGYRLGLRQKDKEIEATKIVDDLLYAYPYQTISDTLQRVIFYLAIIETNKNATILLEEPESHMSPFYIRDIAERIARDKNNQYFLVTHNPYFLVTLIEKTKLADLAVSVTYLEDYQTKLKRFSKRDLEELTDLDTAIFFNLDKFVEVESIV